MLSATQDRTLKYLFHSRALCKLPVPESVKDMFLVFVRLAKGESSKDEDTIWGFMPVSGDMRQKERRNLSMSIAKRYRSKSV